MRAYDVIVVGGGPAGSSCAWRLRRAGLRVLVIDRAGFPRDKLCAGWITPGVLQTLALDPEAYRTGRVFQPITGFRTGLLGGRPVETRYPEPVSYGICRCEFDTYLLDRSGAEALTGVAVTGLRRVNGSWIVNDRAAAPMLVGAGGHFCPVARALNPRVHHEPVVAAQEIEVRLSPADARACPVAPETPELYFCPDLRGYGWIFRKQDVLNVGVGRQDRHHLTAHARELLGCLRKAGRVPPAVADRWPGHAYLLYDSSPRRLVGDAVLLAGDAAGLAYAESGEGIRPAIESGLLAADAILGAGGRFEQARLMPYAAATRRRFGSRRWRRAAGRVVPPPFRRLLAARLLGTRWFTRRVLLDEYFLHTRDEVLASSHQRG